jgi:hypothetical protein
VISHLYLATRDNMRFGVPARVHKEEGIRKRRNGWNFLCLRSAAQHASILAVKAAGALVAYYLFDSTAIGLTFQGARYDALFSSLPADGQRRDRSVAGA